jgi:hypothetical protein
LKAAFLLSAIRVWGAVLLAMREKNKQDGVFTIARNASVA